MANKQTAVEWLKEQYYESEGKLTNKDFEQAKQIEKEQLKDAYGKVVVNEARELIDAEQYYNETYGN
jgi:hypothetical protein